MVEQLRQSRDAAGEEPWIVISAADPLNLFGVITPGARVPATHRNALIVQGGKLLASRQAGVVAFHQEVDQATQWAMRRAMTTGRPPEDRPPPMQLTEPECVAPWYSAEIGTVCRAAFRRATIRHMSARSSHSLARRQFLQAGTLALFAGAAPAKIVRGFTPNSADGVHSFGRAKRCILVYLLGGPPQIDMWDMKPDAPAEIRGPFQSIASPVAGMRFCEHLPRLAARAGDLAILQFGNVSEQRSSGDDLPHAHRPRVARAAGRQHRAPPFARRRSAHGRRGGQVQASQRRPCPATWPFPKCACG